MEEYRFVMAENKVIAQENIKTFSYQSSCGAFAGTQDMPLRTQLEHRHLPV